MNVNNKIPFIFLILVLFITIIYFPKTQPIDRPMNNEASGLSGVVEIGVISPTNETYAQYEYIAKLAEDELNLICNESNLEVSFSFNVSSGESSPAVVLERVMDQWRRGVNLFVAGGYHSQLTAMRSFINDNKVLVISPSSTNIDMNHVDYIYRMSPNDSLYGPSLTSLLLEYGINRVLLLGRDNLFNYDGVWFSDAYLELGGEVIDTLTYPYDVEFNAVLGEAEAILESQAGSDIGILLIDSIRADEIQQASEQYNRLMNSTWISPYAYRYPSLNITGSSTVKFLSLSPLLVQSEATKAVEEEFKNRFDEEIDFVDGCVFDSCMLLGLSVIDLTNSSYIRSELPKVAESYVGLTGPIGFDENGDRDIFRMGLFAYGFNENPEWSLGEYYDYSLE